MVALESPVSLLLRTSIFLKKTYGARRNLDFTLPRWKIEDLGLQRKFTIGFHTVSVVQLMEYHIFC